MKKIFLILPLMALVGCSGSENVAPADVEYYEEQNIVACSDSNCSDVAFATPNGNDLVLETAHHVIHIEGRPDTAYGYYVWTGNKGTDQDPDLIVEDGVAAVLVEE